MTLYHVGCSGGKDSTALLLWVIHKSGLPMDRVRVTFCDTGNEDPVTYAHLEMLAEKIVVPAGIAGGIETIIPALQFFPLALKKRRFPSRKAQFCTTELKIKPTMAWIKARWDEGHEVVILNGKRRGESHQRKKTMKDTPVRGFSDFWGCEEWTPLRDWTWNDVVAIHREFSLPLNPLYAMGATRVGCFPCINCGKKEIRLVAKFRPEKIDQIEAEENKHRTVNGRFSSFFPAKTTTKNFNNMTYVRKKDGKEFGASSIRQVVEWAKTARGGQQTLLDLEEPITCQLGYHGCE